ncbi:YadA family autotransporter adhesin [Dyella sp.]|uniref:YadA family autotransporter adhesin n=1 Tax=Dyella sp. TaxID=1869338 RepID=UPI002B463369|nr:YadA-like family protein [Dyella sp.]HKT27928.1 YadA-like family protein [Dyella sp.]
MTKPYSTNKQTLASAYSAVSDSTLETSRKTTGSKSLWALLALLFAPVETVSASLYVNDGNSGNCSQMLGSGLFGIQIPITIITNAACNTSSLSSLISAGAANGTLALNTNGAFLIGNLHVNGALDLNNHTLNNLAAGVSTTDAVNLGQLSASARASATILGGGAAVSVDGTISAPAYAVQSVTAHDVGTALSALDTGIHANTNAIDRLGTKVQAVGDYFASNGIGNGTDSARAIGVNATAIGPHANAQGVGSVVIGNGAKDGTASAATGNAVVIGNHAQVTTALGSTTTTGAMAIGDSSSAYGNASMALGQNAAARNTESFALGASANAIGTGATAVGYLAATDGNNAVAIGRNAHAMGVGATAIGYAATTNATNALAIGNGANAQQNDAIALGVNAVADRANVVSIGSASSQRQLTYVAAGTQRTDAVNVSQLTPALDALGATLHVDGSVSAPTYTVQSTPVPDVASALKVLDDGVTANAASVSGLGVRIGANESAISGLVGGTSGLVQQAGTSAPITVAASSGGGVVDVSGTAGDRRVTGVADAMQSNDAVNLQQLQALQSQIGDVGALAVQYDDAGKSAITLGGVGAGAAVMLHNVANGQQANDAANFGQLIGTAQSTAGALGGHATVNADGTLSAPAYSVQNLSVQDVGSALKVLDDGVTTNAADIGGLGVRVSANENAINGLLGGTSGLVQQAGISAPITVAATSGGSVVDVSGTDGDRRITGIADGTQNNDAANVGQLKSLQNQLGDVAALDVTYDDANQLSVTFGGKSASAPVAVHNVADGVSAYDAVNYGQLAGLQRALQGQIANVGTQIGALDQRVSTLESGGSVSPLPAAENPGTNPDYSGGVTVGSNTATGDGSAAAIGNNAQAAGVHGTAIGSDAYAASYHGTALGGNAVAASDGGVAVGAHANVAAIAGTAVGEGATVTAAASNAVAIGAGSVATQANSVSVGSAGNERTITNVAPGVDATDAVNVSQLQAAQSWAQGYVDQQTQALNERISRLGRRADAGAAAAIAMTHIPQAYAPDQSSLGAGVGSFRGQAAIAVGMSTVTPGGRWVLKASLSSTSQGDMGVGAGAAMVW